MLRVGLTGGLASGKSTVARMLAAKGAYLLQADEIARELMRPGEAVYRELVTHFGKEVVNVDGTLDRRRLATLAFAERRLDEINAVVHPPTISRLHVETEEIRRADPNAVVVVESALIFETAQGGASGWKSRFERVILVTAEDALKTARYVARNPDRDPHEAALDAERRLAAQIPDRAKLRDCDYVIENNGSLEHLTQQVDDLWPKLLA